MEKDDSRLRGFEFTDFMTAFEAVETISTQISRHKSFPTRQINYLIALSALVHRALRDCRLSFYELPWSRSRSTI